jgi:transposase
MPAERVAMRQAREIIRLKFSASVATREIARRLGLAPSTVRETLKRIESAGLVWPLPNEMSDGALEAALYANRRSKRGHRLHSEPDWPAVHRELKRKHVTLLIVWDEYIAANPGGYSYSRFCELYRGFEAKLSPTMRQTHAAGERLFVDYAGDGVPVVIDRLTGEMREAQIFVAVLGASSFTFARATWTQALADWIDAHVRAFEAIGGVPHLLVPDNTKTAVIKACLYDPLVNRTYTEMAAHYETAILPARPRRPRDKAKVEQAVLIVERWLLGRLRHRIFYSLADVNAAIGELLKHLNEERPIRRLGVTRRQLLEEVDRSALKPLPVEAYEFCEWRVCRVGISRRLRSNRPGLPRRRWLPLLQRSLSLRPRRGRRAAHRQNRRDIPEGRADRRAYTQQRKPQAHDHSRSYAFQPSAICRLDDRPYPRGCTRDRIGDGGAVRVDPGAEATS